MYILFKGDIASSEVGDIGIITGRSAVTRAVYTSSDMSTSMGTARVGGSNVLVVVRVSIDAGGYLCCGGSEHPASSRRGSFPAQ